MRIRCVKSVFQTPSSNSCMKSTTSIRARSKSAPSRSINAFYSKHISLISLHLRQVSHRLTDVGTIEVDFSSRWTFTPLMGIPSSKIARWASLTERATSWYLCALLTCSIASVIKPRWSSFDLWIRHRGHGQMPLSRIVARITLGRGEHTCYAQAQAKCTYFSG